MASHGEIAKDIVVALLSRIEGLHRSNIEQNAEEIGQALAKIYRILYQEINK